MPAGRSAAGPQKTGKCAFKTHTARAGNRVFELLLGQAVDRFPFKQPRAMVARRPAAFEGEQPWPQSDLELSVRIEPQAPRLSGRRNRSSGPWAFQQRPMYQSSSSGSILRGSMTVWPRWIASSASGLMCKPASAPWTLLDFREANSARPAGYGRQSLAGGRAGRGRAC